MKNNNVWEKSYQNTKQLWSSNPDSKLMHFSDFELICCCKGLEYDSSHGGI